MARTRTRGTRSARAGARSRQSAVRRAHAVIAEREGRASAPGELGLPLEKGRGTGSRDGGRHADTERGQGDRAPRGGTDEAAEARAIGGAVEGAGGAEESRDARATRDDRESDDQPPRRATRARRDEGEGPEDARNGADADDAGGARSKVGTAAAAIPTAGRVARHALSDGSSDSPHVGRKLARGTGRVALKLACRAAVRTARKAAERVTDGSLSLPHLPDAVPAVRRLPIQCSVDVAVPLGFAWQEWMRFECFTEGIHRVGDVEREGDELHGTLDDVSGTDWRARVLDERDGESFAWQSYEGGDCAGLITFHALAERLTRIEVNLDVRPQGPVEAAQLGLRIADRRARGCLRRFKAQAELVDPAAYEQGQGKQGNAGRRARKS